jgi:hypothetical protein
VSRWFQGFALTALFCSFTFAFFPRTAAAHCRTTTLSGDNQACVKDGLPLFWRSACVTLRLNQKPTRIGTAEQLLALAESNFGSWSTLACPGGKPSVVLNVNGTTRQTLIGFDNAKGAVNENIVLFHDGSWPYGDLQQLALTTLTFQKTNGEIVDADLEVNSTRDLYFGGSLPPNGFDLETILKHEGGHILGLAHSDVADTTMFAIYTPGSTAQRDQKPDDTQGLCEVYPPSGTRSTASGSVAQGPCTAPPADGCGCVTYGARSGTDGWARMLPFLLVVLARLRSYGRRRCAKSANERSSASG